MNPHLYTEVYLNGDFDFNHNSLSPPGTRVLIFEGPTKHCTFENHGVERWYLVPTPEHYRCYTVYAPALRAEIIIKTLKFFQHDWLAPKLSSTDAARQAINDLMEALRNSAPESPLSIGDKKMQAIKPPQKILATSLHTIALTTSLPPRVPPPGPITAPPTRLKTIATHQPK